VRVDAVSAPAQVRAGEPFPLDITLASQAPRRSLLEVRDGGRVIVSRAVELGAGASQVVIETTLDTPGENRLEVVVKTPGDPEAGNDRLTRGVQTLDRARALYVEGRPESAGHLLRALTDGGFEVDAIAPPQTPSRVEALAGFDAIVLSDAPAKSFTAAQMRAIADYVDEGGGFLLAGGEEVYGAEGYAGSPVERILPVRFRIKDRPDDLALVVVLDKSWSMSGPAMELSKEAVKAAVDVLQRDHRFGLVTFNDQFDWTVPLQTLGDRAAIKRTISAIMPSSHTNIFPALDAAYKALQRIEARSRHVILLSDGQTYPDEYERLVTAMNAARLTVSTVAVGTEADRTLLANIARWGKGQAYIAEDPKEVPQIFVKEAQRSKPRTLNETPFQPTIVKPVEMFAGVDLASAPPLLGYTRMRAKDDAEILLTAEGDDPLLVRGRYGLGRSAVFTSDVKNRWAADWVRWNGYGKFWSQVVRELSRRAPESDSTLDARLERGRLSVTLEAVDRRGAYRNNLRPRVELSGPGSSKVVDLRQTAPGRYEAVLDAPGAGMVRAHLVGDGSTPTAFAGRDYPDELRFEGPDTDFLRRLAETTGGRLAATPSEALADLGDRAERRINLWPWFVSAALALYLVDLLLRRVRLFESSQAAPHAAAPPRRMARAS
jgi:uncharacterized membrane protein